LKRGEKSRGVKFKDAAKNFETKTLSWKKVETHLEN